MGMLFNLFEGKTLHHRKTTKRRNANETLSCPVVAFKSFCFANIEPEGVADGEHCSRMMLNTGEKNFNASPANQRRVLFVERRLLELCLG